MSLNRNPRIAILWHGDRESPNNTALASANILKQTMGPEGEQYVKRVPVVSDAIVANNWAEL